MSVDGLILTRQGRLWIYRIIFSVWISVTAVLPLRGKSAVNAVDRHIGCPL